MDCFSRRFLMLLLIILLDSPITCQSWGWFSSSSFSRSHISNPDFSMEVSTDLKAVQVVKEVNNKLACWQKAYYLQVTSSLAARKWLLDKEEKRKRFAWYLSDCFVRDSGRPAFPICNDKSTMMSCLNQLDDRQHKIYLEFFLETNTICQQLQSYAFKNEIERLVRSAQDTQDKLDILGESVSSKMEDFAMSKPMTSEL